MFEFGINSALCNLKRISITRAEQHLIDLATTGFFIISTSFIMPMIGGMAGASMRNTPLPSHV